MEDLDSANRMLDKVLAGKENLLAGREADIQVNRSNKAAVLVVQGRLQDAECILRDIVRMRQNMLGLLHSSTLFSIKALTNVFERMEVPELQGLYVGGSHYGTKWGTAVCRSWRHLCRVLFN